VTKQAEAQKRVEERARAKRDDFFLANEVLGYDFVPEVHAELFACFPRYDAEKSWVEQSEQKDYMVLWSRGHYKTTAVVVQAIKIILNFPNIRILLMQGSVQVTQTLLAQISSHFSGQAFGSRLQELFPEFCGVQQEGEWNLNKSVRKQTANRMTTPARTALQLAQATITVASPKSVKTGQHYDIGFFDDLVNESNYQNPKLLIKVQENFTLGQSLIDPGNYRFVTGTRYAFGDLYEQIVRWQEKDHKWLIDIRDCWTDASKNLPDEAKEPRFPQFRKKNGELGGFTRELLLQMQRDDTATFACQYLNKPVHTSKQPFNKEMLYGACVPAKDSPWLSQSLMMLDLASSDAPKADDSVITVGQMDALGKMYVTGIRGDQWVPFDFALNVIDMALRHRPAKIVMEKTASAVYFSDYLQMLARQKGVVLPIDFVKVDTRADAKNMRVTGFAGVVKSGRTKFLMGLPGFDKLVEQACEFPKGRYGHDDYIDCVALLWQEITKEFMALPMRSTQTNPILALIADRENALVKQLTSAEFQAVSSPDLTGLE
jgi:hypothetical protein